MTFEEFRLEYHKCAPKDHLPLFADYLEFIVSLDGHLMVKYGDEFIPLSNDSTEFDDWSTVFEEVIEWFKKRPAG